MQDVYLDDLNPKRKPILLKTERFIKLMRTFIFYVARKHEFIAARIRANLHGVLHQSFTEALPLHLWRDDDILDDAFGHTLVSEIVHQEQGEGADDFVGVFCQVDGVVGIGFYSGKNCLGSCQAKAGRVAVEDLVKVEQGRNIRFLGGAKGQICHIGG